MHYWTCIRHPQASIPLSAYRIAVTARTILQVSYFNNGLRITFLKLFYFSRVIAACCVLHNISIDRRQVNDYEYKYEDEMQLPIVDHVREENALALRQKRFEKRNNITLNYFTWNTHMGNQFPSSVWRNRGRVWYVVAIYRRKYTYERKRKSQIFILIVYWLHGFFNFRHFCRNLVYRQRNTAFLQHLNVF